MDIQEETPCSQLADVIGADKGEVDQQPASTFHSFVLVVDIHPDVIDDSTDDGITMDALFFSPSTLIVSDLKEEMVEEKNQDISLFSLQDKRVMHSPTPEDYSEVESIGCQSSYEREISYKEQHDREKESSIDIHEETSCAQLAYVVGVDKGEMEELKV